jgi:hypothetical protein
MSNYAVANSGGAAVRDAIIPTIYFVLVLALPAISNLIDNGQLKVMISFLILPISVLIMARDPRFKINRNLAFGAAIAAYFIIAAIAGVSSDFKQTIEDPKNSTSKLKSGLIWTGIILLYMLLIIVPSVSGMTKLYDTANMA